MGIGITSNQRSMRSMVVATHVSIPNGDRHYLEPHNHRNACIWIGWFQSPMGIGITSNRRRSTLRGCV